MTPLGTGLRSGSCKAPKVDEHSLFTSIQVSLAVLEGDLQIYEPWKKKRSRPTHCYATLYANETSPFMVWYKIVRNKSGSNSSADSTPSTPRPRCVIPVSRATLMKAAGGAFEMTDFSSKLTFRFVAKTIREAEMWVEKLAEESLREVNLDMRSLCSSRSSYSSITSALASPDVIDSSTHRVSPFPNGEKKPSSNDRSISASEAGPIFNFLDDEDDELLESSKIYDGLAENDDKDDVFEFQSVSRNHLESPTRYSIALGSPRQHIRAQPHLRLNVVLDKRRPDLRSVLDCMPRTSKATESSQQSKLPFSEFFVHVPNS